MTRVLEERVNAIAARQHGVVTRGQLLAAGLSAGAVRHRLASGRLRRLHRGVFLAGPLSPPRCLEMSAVLACGPRALLSHLSAAALWLPPGSGAPAFRSPSERAAETGPVDVTVERGGHGPRPGIRIHRARQLDLADRTVRDGIPITTPVRTMVDVAALVDAKRLEWMTALLAREGLLDLDDLAARLPEFRGRPGIPALRAILERHGGPVLTRSEAESTFLELIREAGLSVPKANVRVGPYELDFYWPMERLAVEIDGFRHHSSRPRFEGDRRKDAWLRARGIGVVRLSWHQLTAEAMATAVQVGQALAHAAR